MRDGPTATSGLLQGTTGRERHYLASRKLTSSFFPVVNKTPERDKLTLTWLHFLHRFSSFGHVHLLSQTGNERSIWWLSGDSKSPSLPHTSPFLSPSSILPPSSLAIFYLISPFIAGFFFSLLLFCFFQPSWEACVCHAGQRRVEETRGVTDRNEKQTLGMDPHRIYVNQPHFLLQDPPLPLSLESYWICCHILFLQTTPTMYLTVQYCAKLASHDYFVL